MAITPSTNDARRETEFRFNSDVPISLESQDRFNHKYFVDTLLYIIQHSISPINVGLYGKWGVGKSSILKLLEKKVEADGLGSKYKLVNIDAWKLSPNSLKQELLVELNSQIGIMKTQEIEDKLYNVHEEEAESLTKQAREMLYKRWFIYGALIVAPLLVGYIVDSENTKGVLSPSIFSSILLPSMVALYEKFHSLSKDVAKSTKKIVPRVESSQQFQSLFKKLIDTEREKLEKDSLIVIMLDNLDRCEDHAVVEMLGLIRTFMNIEGCIFIIACDDQAIVNHLISANRISPTEKAARDYLAKFFQVSLSIPPLVDGDIDRYADEIIRTLPFNVDPSVPSIIVSGSLINPRKVVQFVNNLVVLYTLARKKEEQHVISKGAVTGNTAFLAKILVIREEYPEFYRELEKREDILEFIERYLRGETVKEINSREIEIILNHQGSGRLRYFLQATLGISTSRISDFLRLAQESFESSISELEDFNLKIRNNEYESIIQTLKTASPDQRQQLFRNIIKLADDFVERERFLYATNTISVLIESVELSDGQTRVEVLNRIGRYVQQSGIAAYLKVFKLEKIFEVLHLIIPSLREPILELYIKDMITGNVELDTAIFDQLIINRALLSNQLIELFNEKTALFVSSNKPNSMYPFERLAREDKAVKGILKASTIKRMLRTLEVALNERTYKERIELYLKSYLSKETSAALIERLFSNIKRDNIKDLTSFHAQMAIENLRGLSPDDISVGGSSLLLKKSEELYEKIPNESDKGKIVLATIAGYKSMSEQDKKKFADGMLTRKIANGEPGILKDIVGYSKEKQARILDHDPVYGNLLNRIDQLGIIDQSIPDFIVEFTPGERRDKLVEFLVNRMKQQNISHHFAVSIDKYPLMFTETQGKRLAKSLINQAGIKYWDEAEVLLNTASHFIEGSDVEMVPSMISVVQQWIRDDNQDVNRAGARIVNIILPKIDESHRNMLIDELISRLKQTVPKHSAFEDYVTILMKEFAAMSSKQKNKLVEYVKSILSSENNRRSQKILIQKIPDNGFTIIALTLAELAASDSELYSHCVDLLRRMKPNVPTYEWNSVEFKLPELKTSD